MWFVCLWRWFRNKTQRSFIPFRQHCLYCDHFCRDVPRGNKLEYLHALWHTACSAHDYPVSTVLILKLSCINSLIWSVTLLDADGRTLYLLIWVWRVRYFPIKSARASDQLKPVTHFPSPCSRPPLLPLLHLYPDESPDELEAGAATPPSHFSGSRVSSANLFPRPLLRNRWTRAHFCVQCLTRHHSDAAQG